MRPPITYYGGKQRLVKELIKLIPEHRLYCEPFMGGGALYFNKPPSEAEIINDINGEVSNFYSVIQTDFEALKIKVEATLHSRRTYKEAMAIYKTPMDKKPSLTAVTRAWAFWVVTNQGFAGKIGSWALSRDNKIGKTLAGKREAFTKEYAERLKFTEIESDDGVKVIKHYDGEDTFFYIDPPYFNSDCGHYKGYTEEDYRTLLNILASLKGKFLLSSYPSDVLSEYIAKQGWNYKEKKQKVSVTCVAKKEKTEVMVYNYKPNEKQATIELPEGKGMQYFIDMCKQEGQENVQVVLKNSGEESLDVAAGVSCFGVIKNHYDPMETSLLPLDKEATLLIASSGSLPPLIVRDDPPRSPAMNNKIKALGDLIKDGHGKAITPGGIATVPQPPVVAEPLVEEPEEKPALSIIHEQKLLYKSTALNYYVLGELPMEFASLPVTIAVTESTSDRRERYKLDLYERAECERCVADISAHFYIDRQIVLTAIVQLTDLLEQYRDGLVASQQAQYKAVKPQKAVVALNEKEAIAFLGQPNLMERMDKLLEQAGIQENIRLLVYVTGASYKSDTPLHIGIMGDGNCVKGIIGLTGQCLPEEDMIVLNYVSGKSFYHCNGDELKNKALLLPHGVDKQAAYALKLLQQKEPLITATSTKDKLGNIISAFKQVHSHLSTIVHVEEQDNNSITVAIEPHADRSMQYYNKKVAGLIDEKEELKAKELLQNMVRCINPMQVINPLAGKITLPVNDTVRVQINQHYQSLVKQVCLLHQYQREKDVMGRLIATVEDMKIASDMLFSSTLLDTDELDTATRNFFEALKMYVIAKAGEQRNEYWFSMPELRKELGYSGSGSFRFMSRLYKLDYVERSGYANRGFKYRIAYWEDADKVRKQVKDNINAQLELSGMPNGKHPVGMPGTTPALTSPAGMPTFEKYTYALNERVPHIGKPRNKKILTTP